MERSVNNTQRFRLANNLWIENQSVEPLHVCLINLFADGRHFALLVAWRGREGFARDRVYFCNDPARMRLDDLRAVTEINFVTVVVRRIVAGGDHDASICFQVANSKREFRHRTRSIKYECVATILRRNFRSETGEFL